MKTEILSWKIFNDTVDGLAAQIKVSGRALNSIYGIPRGGLVLAVMLSHRLRLPLVTSLADIGNLTLIVDDISDTGKQLTPFTGHVTATIHITTYTKYIPHFYALTRKADWVRYPWEA